MCIGWTIKGLVHIILINVILWMEEQTLLKLDVFKSWDIKKCEKWNLQTRTDQVWGPPCLHFKENLGFPRAVNEAGA